MISNHRSRVFRILPFVAALLGTVGSVSAQEATVDPFKSDAGEWARIKEAAKKEGSVVVIGPGFPTFRTPLVEAFKKATGVTVEYLSLPPGEVMARVDREAKAGQMTVDVNIGGTSICWVMAGRGLIENASRLIVDPSLFDANSWKGGKMRPIAPAPSLPKDFICGLQTSEWVMTDLFVNTNLVPAGSIKSWKDLLKPEFKGKIASADPRAPGPAQTTAGYLRTLFGDDYLKDLYLGQKVVLMTDADQLAQGVARGNYSVGLSLLAASVEQLRRQQLPIDRVFPADGPGILTGGFGTVFRYKGGPHPNAAALFMNWFASKEAQEIAEAGTLEPSLRTDTGHKVPSYLIPRADVTYRYNDWAPDYFFANRQPAVTFVTQMLGR
jgi:ABC-type Fe3+ transport system substrate-binding protein